MACAYEEHRVEFAQRRNVRLEVPSLLRPHHLRRARAECKNRRIDLGMTMAMALAMQVWPPNLHFSAVVQDLFLGDELDDVVGDGEEPADLPLPPRLPVRCHGLQLPLLAEHRGCRWMEGGPCVLFAVSKDFRFRHEDSSKSSPARLVTALERASAEGTPFPDPDMSSPSSSLANFSFIRSISARNATA